MNRLKRACGGRSRRYTVGILGVGRRVPGPLRRPHAHPPGLRGLARRRQPAPARRPPSGCFPAAAAADDAAAARKGSGGWRGGDPMRRRRGVWGGGDWEQKPRRPLQFSPRSSRSSRSRSRRRSPFHTLLSLLPWAFFATAAMMSPLPLGSIGCYIEGPIYCQCNNVVVKIHRSELWSTLDKYHLHNF